MVEERLSLDKYIQQKVSAPPYLKPKTSLGQKTSYGPEEVVYQGLKKGYYENPEQLQPLINHVRRHIITDSNILSSPEGIYTWIVKDGHLYITPLRTNQEIGSLHANLNAMTMSEENITYFDPITLKPKNKDNPLPAHRKPFAAGEMLITGNPSNEVRTIYYNIQSGTFSEPRFRECAKRLGIKPKEWIQRIDELGTSCRDPLLQEIEQLFHNILGDSVRFSFLDCRPETNRALAVIDWLGNSYDHSECKNENDYLEYLAGRNLIRRYHHKNSSANRELFNTFYTTTLKRSANQMNLPLSSSSSLPTRTILKAPRTVVKAPPSGGKRSTRKKKTHRGLKEKRGLKRRSQRQQKR